MRIKNHLKAFIEIHALSDLFIGNCTLFDSFYYNTRDRGISDLTKCNYTILRVPHKTYYGRFGFNKNSALKFRKFHAPNGTVHSDCTDPTQATARSVIVLVSRMQKRGAGVTNFVKSKETFRSDRRNDQAGKSGPSKVAPLIYNQNFRDDVKVNKNDQKPTEKSRANKIGPFCPLG